MDNPAGRPRRLMDVVASIVILAEAVLLAVVGAGYVLYAVMGQSTDVVVVSTLAMVALALAGLLGYAALAWWRGRDWARAVVLTWQVLQLSVGVFYAGGEPVVASVLIGSAVLVAAAVLTRSGNWTQRTP